MKIKQVLISWMGQAIEYLSGDARQSWLSQMGIGPDGIGPMTQRTAMQISTVWRCVRLLSECISTLPTVLYKRTSNGRDLAVLHPLYSLLGSSPNPNMTSVTFWEIVVVAMALWGNAFAGIKRNSLGAIYQIDFWRPEFVQIQYNMDGTIAYYWLMVSGTRTRFDPIDVMHIPSFTFDGITGVSSIFYGATVFRTAMDAESAARKVFSSGIRSSGFLSTPDAVFLNKEQRDTFRDNMNEFRGDKNAGKVMVLEGGVKFSPLSMTPLDAEMLATRAYSVEEICRWFGIPPDMVGHGDKQTSWGTGVEQRMIAFVRFSLRAWCVRIEKAVSFNLLTPTERNKYYLEFGLEGFLRGDSAARAAFYTAMLNNGVLTSDEVRELENYPKMGGNAAVLRVQSAMVPLDQLGQAPPSIDTALKAWMESNNVG